jgi:hypothetical protein
MQGNVPLDMAVVIPGMIATGDCGPVMISIFVLLMTTLPALVRLFIYL